MTAPHRRREQTRWYRVPGVHVFIYEAFGGSLSLPIAAKSQSSVQGAHARGTITA